MGRLSCWGAVGVRQTRISNANVVLCRLCPSAAGPTSIAIVEGASRPSAEPVIAPRCAASLRRRRGIVVAPSHLRAAVVAALLLRRRRAVVS